MNPLLLELAIHNTSSQQDYLPGYCFSIKPDCTVYHKENENSSGPGINSRLAEFFIEFKSLTEDDPFRDPLAAAGPAPVKGNNPRSAHFLSDLKGNRSNILGKLGTYAAVQIDSQYRTHSFLVLIIGTYARLMRWDRGGMIFTEPIYYNTHAEFFDFFEAYDCASLDVRGHDSIIASPKDFEISDALQAWPSLKSRTFLVVSLCNEAGHASPRCYVIPSPEVRPSLPVSRSDHRVIRRSRRAPRRSFEIT